MVSAPKVKLPASARNPAFPLLLADLRIVYDLHLQIASSIAAMRKGEYHYESRSEQSTATVVTLAGGDVVSALVPLVVGLLCTAVTYGRRSWAWA